MVHFTVDTTVLLILVYHVIMATCLDHIRPEDDRIWSKHVAVII
jgi:hypothetical protein